ncbi:MAG TPA: GNAT family N-acetyltransferase [Steroidobacteraceae bacterium]|nr:GNAT family N-acetyltransferase [Steroidobacteraceae bacterium]
MSSTTTIQPAAVEDIDSLLPMVEQYWRFENIEGFDPARMRALLTRVLEDASLGRVWIARVYGEPAGYLLAVYVFSLEHQGLTAEIDEFFVDPQHRSLGIGASMLAAAEAQFRTEECTNVSLQLGRSNEAARKFYRQHGFENRAGYELVTKIL